MITAPHSRTSAPSFAAKCWGSLRGRLSWAVRREQLTVMLDAGVQLLPGTDSGIPRTPNSKYAHSFLAYLDLGLTPAEVIDLVTRRAAQALRIDDRTGTLTAGLSAGLSADLIAVPGDPTQDLTVLATPILAMTAGDLHYPTAEEYTRQ